MTNGSNLWQITVDELYMNKVISFRAVVSWVFQPITSQQNRPIGLKDHVQCQQVTKFFFTFKTLKINFTKVVETSLTNNSRSFSGLPWPGSSHYTNYFTASFKGSNHLLWTVNFSLKMNPALFIRVAINSCLFSFNLINWNFLILCSVSL